MKKGFILFFILLFPSLLYLFLSTGKHNILSLPIYGPREAVKTVVEGKEQVDTLYHTIPDFSFTNQYAEKISGKDLKDKIVVVDFFFTTCQSICPKMSTELTRVQEKSKEIKAFCIISHTVNPENDSVEVLADYAQKMHAEKGRWHFVTGNKKELYDLARYGYFITAMDGDGGADDFIHSEKFVLIDRQGYIRGYYDGTSREDVDRLIDEIKVLKAEEFIPKKSKKNA